MELKGKGTIWLMYENGNRKIFLLPKTLKPLNSATFIIYIRLIIVHLFMKLCHRCFFYIRENICFLSYEQTHLYIKLNYR